MSDTPRTDAIKAGWLVTGARWEDMTALARELERENAMLREHIRVLTQGTFGEHRLPTLDQVYAARTVIRMKP